MTALTILYFILALVFLCQLVYLGLGHRQWKAHYFGKRVYWLYWVTAYLALAGLTTNTYIVLKEVL